MAQADHLAIGSGFPGIALMRAAGQAVFERAGSLLEPGRKVLVLCGTGNNGGDGFVAARLLREAGFLVEVGLAGSADRLTGDAKIAWQDMLAHGITPIDAGDCRPEEAGLIIDALLGAGLDRPVAGALGNLIGRMNRSAVPVLAVDLPSGINGATGEAMGVAVIARHTVTFFRKK
ncbi:MAG: NAD(P)H-hydrate epimerase, partial [Nitratireductor sp.]|nr:NAD(P)H-hydrate epimerase [Nitratireductor sp.]